MSAEHVEEFYKGHRELIAFLLERGQLSFANDANDNFRRSLILAIASHFEHEISGIVRALPSRHANGNPFLTELVAQKVVARQYHTFFKWDASNANTFFSMFGAEYKAAAEKKFKDDAEFKAAVLAFLSLGNTRNNIAHQNYVQFALDMTPEDIIKKFRQAQVFVAYVRATLLPPARPETTPGDAA